MESRTPWECRRRELVYSSGEFQVFHDDVIRPDGSTGGYVHASIPGSVTVLALDDDGHAAITRQWIYVHGAVQWRLPGGRIDATDADPESAGRRELAEETGITAAHWEPLGVVNGADASTNHRDHVFLATGLTFGPAELGPGESDLVVHLLPFEHLLLLLDTGDLPHSGSAFAVLAAYRRAHCFPFPDSTGGGPSLADEVLPIGF